VSLERIIPHWPAAMKCATAARYCDLSEPEFEREVAAGRLPAPFVVGRRQHWSKAQLDKALLIMAGEVLDGSDIVIGERDAV
jgi:hypothetical protein